MPALNGEVTQTLRDGSGNTVIEAVYFFTPATGALRDDVYTDPTDGTQYGPAGLIVVNHTGVQQAVVVTNPDVGTKTFTVPVAGFVIDAATLAKPPNRITTTAQLNGFTFQLA
jgi:hypothetical protein